MSEGDSEYIEHPLKMMTTDSLDSTTMNSRFWFDMYQRLKTEMAKERRENIDQQALAIRE